MRFCRINDWSVLAGVDALVLDALCNGRGCILGCSAVVRTIGRSRAVSSTKPELELGLCGSFGVSSLGWVGARFIVQTTIKWGQLKHQIQRKS